MKKSTFELNNKPMSSFKIGASSFPAFSGLGQYVNRGISACVPNQGPIPPGEYFILDGWLRDLFSGKGEWFALYANDGKIDDQIWCEQVKRGQFRLHPKGRTGMSQGCIVIDRPNDFQVVSSILRNGEPQLIADTEIRAWGKVSVK